MPARNFEEVVVPHLDAAFNYARWLTRNDVDAEDVVQDATIRALRYFSSLRNDDARAWLLTIVRNTWYGRLGQQGASQRAGVYDEMTDDRRDERLGPEALVTAAAGGRAGAARTRVSCRSTFVKSSCCASSKDSRTRRLPRWSACRSERSCRGCRVHASGS